MKKNVSMFLALAMSVAMLAGCGDNHDHEEEVKGEQVGEEVTASHYPVTINNFNQSVVYDAKPENVVSLNLNTAEIIVALGAIDSIVGVSTGNFSLEDVGSEHYNDMSKLDFPSEVNTGIPTLEGMLSLEPSLVVANSYYFNVPFFGTMDDYKANGTEFFIPEGSYIANATIENTYQDIINLGLIFENTDEAEEIVNTMKEAVESVQKTVSKEDSRSVVILDSINEDGTFVVVGGIGLGQNLMELAGGDNVFANEDSQYAVVSAEALIASNPSLIILSDYGTQDDDVENNIEYLLSAVELSSIDAIANENFGVISLYKTFPSMQNAEAVELIASFLYPDLFN